MLCDLEAWSETIGLGFLPISPTVPTPTAAGDAKHPQRGRLGLSAAALTPSCWASPASEIQPPCRATRQGFQYPVEPN